MNRIVEARSYLLGDTDRELARLIRQGALFSEFTRDVFLRAGIGRGMRVLDVGCGAGDVSMILADLVGHEGSVLGIDRSVAALDTARARIAAAGTTNVRFEQAELQHFTGDGYDAVVGRFILIHLPDPAASLRLLARRVRPGGILAFVEIDIAVSNAIPRADLFARCLDLITSVYRRVDLEPDMGSRLYAEFRSAGLKPDIVGDCRVEAGPHSHAHDYIADSLRSLLPSIVAHGLATEAEMDVDTLSDRLRAESLARDLCFIFPLTVGAWARVP